MPSLFQDIRYALRQLRNNLGFTSVAVLSLALAIGANTTVFSFANQLLFVTLGVPRPNELRLLSVAHDDHSPIQRTWSSSWTGQDGKQHINAFSLPVYEQLRVQNRVLSDIAAYKDYPRVDVTANGNAQAADAELVSGNFYTLMQLKPELGRGILPSDDAVPGRGNVVVLSYSYWHRAFGGAVDAIGKTVMVDTLPFTVIGVNPSAFRGPDGADEPSPQIYVPLSMAQTLHPSDSVRASLTGPNFWWLQLVARTKANISDTQAKASLQVALVAAVRDTMTVAKDDTMPEIVLDNGSRGAIIHDLSGHSKQIYILIGFAGLVLLLACANIANLMLARATGREREMSLRMAIGAARARILRQVLTESLLLSFVGGAAGLLLGYVGRNLIPYLMNTDWDGGDLNTSFDWRVFAFTSSITLATGILFGILPALHSTGASISTTLKESSHSASRRRKVWSGKAIVGFQVALSTLLVTSAVFFVRTVFNLTAIDPGFRAEGRLLFEVNPPPARYRSAKAIALDYQLQSLFSRLPGVQGAALANVPLAGGTMWSSGFFVEGAKGRPFPARDPRNYPVLDFVSNNFFQVMQIPVLFGRGFTEQDTESSTPVSVINDSLAKLYFPNENPIGKRFRVSDQTTKVPRWIEIVGVCADTRYASMRDEPPPIHFEPYRQQTEIGDATFIVKSSLAQATLIPELRNAARQLDPDLPLIQIRSQQQQIDTSMQQERMFASLTAGFGFLALALACVGIYGIMAYTVSQRTNEIGIRLALGAARQQIRGMVLSETGWLAGVGVLTGLCTFLGLVRLIASMLYGLKPWDALTLGCSMLLLFAVALIAGWLPARRASHVDPIQALRNE